MNKSHVQNLVDTHYVQDNVFQRQNQYYKTLQEEERLEKLKADNFELKKQLNKLTNPMHDPTKSIYSTNVKRPHYYSSNIQQSQILEQEHKISQLEQTIKHQDEVINKMNQYANNISKYMWNIQKIDGEIYNRLSIPNPHQRLLQQIKYALRTGQRRELVNDILNKIL